MVIGLRLVVRPIGSRIRAGVGHVRVGLFRLAGLGRGRGPVIIGVGLGTPAERAGEDIATGDAVRLRISRYSSFERKWVNMFAVVDAP